MPLELETYATQRARWPHDGKVILAQYDDTSVVVYQAFHAVTAEHAVRHGRLGGPRYSFDRMSWIKPNFLWMTYRCGWLTKDDDQSHVLAIRLDRGFFDGLLERAVASSWRASAYPTEAEWSQALKASEVRLQWDPDHGPRGEKLDRRAIQLGLRGKTLRAFVEEATQSIKGVSDLVLAERANRDDESRLRTPRESPYPVDSETARRALGL